MTTLPDTPKAALENYINELETLYYPWYEVAAQRHYYISFVLQAIAIFAGFATAIIAALIGTEQLSGLSWMRVLLIVLPLLGSIASTLLIQTRVRDLMSLREQGRQRVQHLIETGMVRFAAASTPQDHTQIHEWLVQQVAGLEADQSRRFYEIVPRQLAITKGSPQLDSKIGGE